MTSRDLLPSPDYEAAHSPDKYAGKNCSSCDAWKSSLVVAFSGITSLYDNHFMTTHCRRQQPDEFVTSYCYEKLRLLDDCDMPWELPAARQCLIDGIDNSTRVMILWLHPLNMSPEHFTHQASQLELATNRRSSSKPYPDNVALHDIASRPTCC